jgi:hypothetical protein
MRVGGLEFECGWEQNVGTLQLAPRNSGVLHSGARSVRIVRKLAPQTARHLVCDLIRSRSLTTAAMIWAATAQVHTPSRLFAFSKTE